MQVKTTEMSIALVAYMICETLCGEFWSYLALNYEVKIGKEHLRYM